MMTAPERSLARAVGFVTGRVRGWAGQIRSSFAGELLREAKEDRITGLAAEVTFFVVLSVVPGVVAIVASLAFADRIIGGELAARAEETLTTFLRSVLTDQASAAIDVVAELFDREQPGILSVAMAGTVWGFSRGLLGLIRALEVAYDLPPDAWWKQRARAVVLAVSTIVILALLLAVVVIGPLLGLLRLLLETVRLEALIEPLLWLRFPLAFVLLVVWAWLLYHAGPSLRTPWRAELPGAVLAGALWLLASVGFRIYLEVAAGLNQIFGVLGGVLIVMVWLYLLSLSLLAGGELNAALHRRAAESGARERDPRRPPGSKDRRGPRQSRSAARNADPSR